MTVPSIPTAVVVAATAALLACGGDPRPAPVRLAGAPRPPAGVAPVGAFVVDTQTVELPLALAAQLYAERDAVVVARAPGSVDSLFADLGDRVRTGQPLAALESVDQQIAVDSAQAAYESLLRIAARARALTKSGGVTTADSEQVEFQLREADILRRKARRALELTRVTAPFDGVVTARFVRPRRFVGIGDTLFRVTETAPLYARVRVPEAGATEVRIGDAASVIGAGGARATATVVHAAPIIDAASGTRELVLRVSHGDARLVAGASVVVEIGRERRRVVSVPRAAIAPEGYAIVVEQGRTTLRPVAIGRDLGHGRVEVVSGLAPGERLARPGS